MPDQQGRPTLRDLIEEIEDDIERADLRQPVERAVERAIRHYQPVRYFFNERSLTFQTQAGADVYGAGDASDLLDLMAIDSIVLIEGGTSVPLRRVPETSIEAWDDTGSSARPCAYAYFDRSLRLWPMPSATWTIRITAHVRLPVPDLDGSNGWTNEASSLIAAFAKRHLAVNALRDTAFAQAQAIIVAEEERRLRGRSNVIASSGEIAAYSL